MSFIKSIVLPVDFSAPSRAAAARAALLARSLDASLHVVHGAHFPRPEISQEFAIPGLSWEALQEAAHKEVSQVSAGLRERGAEVSEEVSELDPIEAIRRAVDRHDADLVVMGTHGRSGFQHILFGSVAELTVRTSSCPVWTVKEDEDRAGDPIEGILVATDFSDHAAAALDFAIDLARPLGARIELTHVFSIPAHYFTPYGVAPADALVTELIESAKTMLRECAVAISSEGVEVESHFRRAAASVAISELAAEVEADVIVMGTRGNTGLKYVFLGSVAERTLRLAPCSVVTVGTQRRAR